MNEWMQIAYDEAKKGMDENHGGPFGAVIVRDGELIASSHNKVLLSKDPTTHAEINVIREASQKLGKFDLSDCILYTTCEPCPMCLGAIFWARIPVVYFGATKEEAARGDFDDSLFYEQLEGTNIQVKMEQVDEELNSELFDLWNAKEDKQIY